MPGIGGGDISREQMNERKIKDLESKTVVLSTKGMALSMENIVLKDKIKDLQEAVKVAASFLEDSENNYEEHMNGCNFYQAFHPDAQFCNCGASDWMMKRKKLIVGLNELSSRT